LADRQPVQPELFDVAELPGRPMLHWHGKRPLREIPYYPAQLRERYGEFPVGTEHAGAWVNRLYWGDNLQVMAHLTVEQFYFPLLLQKLSLEDDPEAIQDWRQAVASVLVDPAYDGEVFHARHHRHPRPP
jgi:hypothetical protein